jgi:hypothetical protein
MSGPSVGQGRAHGESALKKGNIMPTDYPVILGMARGGLLDIHYRLGRVLNTCKLDDDTNQDLQEIHQYISDLLKRIQT